MGKKIVIYILFGVILFISACTQNNKIECTKDSDCIIGGCSGQVCAAKEKGDIITTCEYSPAYKCYKLTECSCINNLCVWKNTEEFNNCLRNEGNI